jgi:thioredoxin reductase
MSEQQTTYDVAVVGAGAAGLQAALTLGRMRQRVVVLGTDRYRNDPADAMHNFLGHDGESPAVLRAAARADVERYDTVGFAEHEVLRIDGEAGRFRLDVAGHEPVTAARVLLATGVADTLPDVPGLEEIFGAEAAHCPYCHGYEYADTPIGVLGAAPHVAHLARVVDRLASRVVVLTGGGELDEDTAAALKRDERDVVTTPVTGVARSATGGVTVSLADGSTEELGGLLVKPAWQQAAPFADQLGLELSEVGGVVIDAMGRTSVPGVYAAGDMAQGPGLPMPMASVLTAASGGLLAASACHMDSLAD